jgi:hypothetical protein
MLWLNVFGSLIEKTYRKFLRKNILSFASAALLVSSVGKERCRRWVGAVILAMVVAPAIADTLDSQVRFATFNASLNRFAPGDLATELSVAGSAQPDVIAEIIQRVRPDVLLINEFDYDAGNVALDGFQDNYLGLPHGDAASIVYPYRYTAPSNTGIFSGFDLDNSGAAGDFVPNDSFGFGFFPGQFGMAIYSMYPIDFSSIRTFQLFLWKDMPGALLPDDPSTFPIRRTGIRRPSLTSSGCHQRVTGTSLSRSAREPYISLSVIRHLPSSTGPRIATASATMTRFASGQITFTQTVAPTSMTIIETTAGCTPLTVLSSPVI